MTIGYRGYINQTVVGAYAKSADSVLTPQTAASDHSLHCLLNILFMQSTIKIKSST